MLAHRSPVPVGLDLRTVALLPERIEVASCSVVSEALTNDARHAKASAVHVDVEAVGGVVRLSVSDADDGTDPARGSGHPRVDGPAVQESSQIRGVAAAAESRV